jgi:hypothetical protein
MRTTNACTLESYRRAPAAGPPGLRLVAGTRDRAYRGYPLRENPRLQLQGGDTSDGAVFSVQHLFCFFDGTHFWGSYSDPLGASL